MKSTHKRWYVLCVKYQHEKKINMLLKGKEIDSFLPCVTCVRQWKDRKKKIQKPLFPCYIFVNFNSKKEFSIPLAIDGVFKYLRFGYEYATVRSEEIDKIKRFLNQEGLSNIETTSCLPKVGDKMRINYGS